MGSRQSIYKLFCIKKVLENYYCHKFFAMGKRLHLVPIPVNEIL